MADSQGRSKGDTGYDPSSETDPSQSGGNGNAFDPNQTPPSPSASSNQNWQSNPALSQIGGWVQSFTGKTPTYADVSQWGTGGFDQNYLNSIQNAVYNSSGAQQYRAQQNQPPPDSTAPPAASGPDYSTPQGQLSAVTQWLQSGGFGSDDPNYWVGRINDTGGFTPGNLQYWQSRIAAGKAGEQPGGAYYDAAAAGTPPQLAGQNAIDPAAQNNLFNTLLQRSQQSLNVSPDDPTIKTQTNAYNDQNTRAMRQYLSGLAEKDSGAGGAPNLAAETRSANETAGANSSNFAASLVGNELTQRRDEIQNALSQMGGMLSGNQQLALQQELAQLEDALKQQQINSGNDQFASTFGLNAAQQAWYQDAVNRGLL